MRFFSVLMGICVLTLFRQPLQKREAILQPLRILLKAVDFQNGFTWHQRDAWSGMLLNIFLFIPLGLAVVYRSLVYSGRTSEMKKTVLLGMGVSMLIEIVQYLTKLGTFEIDDVICNVAGCVIGAVMLCKLLKQE